MVLKTELVFLTFFKMLHVFLCPSVKYRERPCRQQHAASCSVTCSE